MPLPGSRHMSTVAVTPVTFCVAILRPLPKNKKQDVAMNLRMAGMAALVLIGLVPAQSAVAQTTVAQQVLDRVFVHDTKSVLNMAFGAVKRPPDFTDLGIGGTAISTCTLTAVRGLWCLDGKVLRNWPNPLQPDSSAVIHCEDNALGFEKSIPASCTGMTVDESGAIWLAGKKRLPANWPARPSWISEAVWIALQTWFKPYALVKVLENPGTTAGSCPAGFTVLAGNLDYCAKEFYSGRFTVTDLLAVDGSAAARFSPGPGAGGNDGVLAIEDRTNVVFFPAAQAAQPVTIAKASTLGLKFGEVLQDVALLQREAPAGPLNNVLATTSTGRVLAKNPATGGAALQVFNIPAKRLPTASKCSNASAEYGVESAASSEVVFVTDRVYCEVVALAPNAGNFTSLVNVKVDNRNLTLSTVDALWPKTYPVIGISIAPGVGIDLASCAAGDGSGCEVITTSSGEPAAEWFDMMLAGPGNFGATVFQVKSIPDCRYPAMLDADSRTLCGSKPDAVITPNGEATTIHAGTGWSNSYPSLPPAALYLNVTPLLPADVIAAFRNGGALPNGLPRLLISPQYRAQARRNFRFGAIAVVPGPGVQFRNTFGGEYDVKALEEASDDTLGCVAGLARSDLIKWDVITAVSETFIGVGSRYADTLANVGCGSVKGSYSRLSILPYDLQISPDTYGKTIVSGTPVLTQGNDAVFARLVDSLFNDLGQAQARLACKPVDSAATPLPYSTCNTLAGKWAEARYKLDVCLDSTFQAIAASGYGTSTRHGGSSLPSSRPYCTQYFPERLAAFNSALPLAAQGSDVANRLGELKSRVKVLQHLYATRFLPSIPAGGFCRERNASGSNLVSASTYTYPPPVQCTAPW